MSRSVSAAVLSDPVRTLDGVRPAQAKAELRGSEPVGSSDAIGPIARDAVVKHYGSVKAAAITLDVDPSLLMRELDAGKLGRLDKDPAAVASVAAALTQAYAPLATPQARGRSVIRNIRRELDELDQAIDATE